MEVAKESVGRGLAPAVCYYQRLITLRRETSPRPTGAGSHLPRIAVVGENPLALPLGELSAKLTERAGYAAARWRGQGSHLVLARCVASGYPSRDYPIRGDAAHGHKQNLPDETSGVLLIEPRRTHPTSTHTKNPPRMGWVFVWRRRRDSNPRDPFEVYAISNRARSTKLRDFSTVPP